MTQDTEVLEKHLELIYAEKDPPKIASLFTDLISQLSSVYVRDNLNLSLFHHFCMLSEFLEKDLGNLKKLLTMLLSAKQAENETDIFLGFVKPVIPEEKKEEAKQEEKKEEKKKERKRPIRSKVTDAWGGTGLHYLARRKLYTVLEAVLKTFEETGNGKKFMIDFFS